MSLDRRIVLLYCIPFINCNNYPLTSIMSYSCNLGILLCHTFRRINYYNDNIGSLYCCNCTNYTVPLNILFDLALSSKSGCINKDIFFSIILNICVYCISCSTCNIGYNNTVLLRKSVDKRRLSYVWLSYDCNLWSLILLFLF